MDTLNEVKVSSMEIENSLEESKSLRSKLDLEYKQYKNICSRAANLYIGISQIYSITVDSYMQIFEKCVNIERVNDNAVFVSQLDE